jgi:acyl CoA:acetate/3-ketoacid CoA transferase beta subunit
VYRKTARYFGPVMAEAASLGASNAIPAVGGAMDLAIEGQRSGVLMSLFDRNDTRRLFGAQSGQLRGGDYPGGWPASWVS